MQTSPESARLVDTTMFYAPASGGVRRYLSEKSAWIARARPDLRHTIIVPGRKTGAPGPGLGYVRCPPLPLSGGYRLPLRRSAWVDRIVAEQPDLIEAGDPYVPGFAAREAGRRLHVPVVGFFHSDLTALARVRFGAWTGPAARRATARLCDGFDLLLAPSQSAATTLRDVGFDRVAVMPLGVDLEVFRPTPEASHRLRHQLGLAKDDRLLVFAGRPAPEKRVDVLVEAVRQLGPQAKLLLIGCGDRFARDPQVVALPFEADSDRLALWLGAADALIHANPSETLGLIALEAMACGTPVIGIDAGGIGEVVDVSAGELASDGSPEALARAARRLFARDQDALRSAARKHVARHYSWPAAFERLMGVYHELTGLAAFRPPVAVPSAPL